jgi:hypothetical protein
MSKEKTAWQHHRCWSREETVAFLNHERLSPLDVAITSTPITAPIDIGASVPEHGVQFDIFYIKR